MPLSSLMLQDDAALQACLVKDPAHVLLGAQGNHVGKIQKALLLLDKAEIRVAELMSQTYGPSTAAAVLAYKKKRKIINTAYQSTPDSIVGKMTIKRLDDDLLVIEAQPSPNRVVCNDSGGGLLTASALARSRSGVVAAAPVTAPKGKLKQRNATIGVIFQESEKAQRVGGGLALMKALIPRARELMKPHGLDFKGGDNHNFGPVIPDSDDILPGSPAACFSVRASAERVHPGFATSLRVMFVPFTEQSQAYGVTDGGVLDTWTFPKFVLINVRKRHADLGTLLHEMVHAAKPIRIEHDRDDKTSVFSEEQSGRDHLPEGHAGSIAAAYYSTAN